MKVFSRIVAVLAVVLSALLPMSTQAGEHGGGGAPEPMVFTTNLGAENYVQFGLIFESATPEAEHLLAELKPRIQHEIILLLAGKEVDRLRTLEGKKQLIEEIVELGNHVIDEDAETGIKEVLFSKFLIQ